MPKYSAKQRKLRGLNGKHHSGPSFIQLPHYVKRSTSYHGLSLTARALLIELIDRYNGSNNGFIVLGVREAAYEIGCNQGTISRAMRELDDADLARPTQVGAWRGRHATEWRITWRRCEKTGDFSPQRLARAEALSPRTSACPSEGGAIRSRKVTAPPSP